MNPFYAALAADYPTLILGAIIITVFAALLKLFLSLYTESKKISLQKLELADNLLKFNLEKPSPTNRFLTEQLFLSMFKCRFEYEQIKVLLKSQAPLESFILFKSGRRFLKLSKSKKSLVLKKRYQTFKVFNWEIQRQSVRELIEYFVMAMLAAFMFVLTWLIYKRGGLFNVDWLVPNLIWYIMSLSCSLLLAFVALLILKDTGKLRFAIELADKLT